MRFSDLSREQLRELADAAVVVLPVGACEQHGPHLPVGTDFMLAELVAARAAGRVTEFPVLVTPTVAAGSSEHHVAFGGTISVSSETLQRYLAECCESLVRSGFRRLFLLNGHGGNIDVIGDVARDVSTRSGVPVASGSYWTIAWDALVALGAHERGLLPGHAGAFETALVAAALPAAGAIPPPRRESTRMADPRGFHPPYRVDDPSVWSRNDGYTDDPSRGDANEGERYLEAVVEAVTAAILEFHSRSAT
ncbi:MAG: creatininase family protein [Nocardioidaceae bacterium]